MTKKVQMGTVVAIKMANTATILVERMKVHPLYQKHYRVSKKYHADTAGQQYEIGNKVKIEETRPTSKTKRWRITGHAETNG